MSRNFLASKEASCNMGAVLVLIVVVVVGGGGGGGGGGSVI
jgi:hypothetical protein